MYAIPSIAICPLESSNIIDVIRQDYINTVMYLYLFSQSDFFFLNKAECSITQMSPNSLTSWSHFLLFQERMTFKPPLYITATSGFNLPFLFSFTFFVSFCCDSCSPLLGLVIGELFFKNSRQLSLLFHWLQIFCLPENKRCTWLQCRLVLQAGVRTI